MSDLEDLTTDVPASSINLEKPVEKEPTMSELNAKIHDLYKAYDVDAYKSYGKGKTVTVSPDMSSHNVIRHILNLYIDTVRQQLDSIDNEEQRTELQIELLKIKTVLNSSLDLLDTKTFLLDVNSVLHIIHGYVNNNVDKIFEDYEIRRRTTHRHL